MLLTAEIEVRIESSQLKNKTSKQEFKAKITEIGINNIQDNVLGWGSHIQVTSSYQKAENQESWGKEETGI